MKRLRAQAAFTLAELLFAAAVGIIAIAAAYSGSITMQRCLVASQEFTSDKCEQARLSDYLALDLRRALTVEGANGNVILTLTLPDFYDADGNPIAPKVVKSENSYAAKYGTDPVTVVYRKYDATVTRTVDNGQPVIIATNVADFECAVDGIGAEKYVHTRISFAPSFRRSGTPSAQTIAATTLHNTIRLRNKL